MGTFLIPIQVGDLARSRFLTMDAMVDTGAVYTLIPEDKRDGLTLESEQTREFFLADESVVEYAVGYARIRFEQAEVIAPVIIGAEGSTPLLGATALENALLAVDPFHERLISVRGSLRSAY